VPVHPFSLIIVLGAVLALVIVWLVVRALVGLFKR
jgi:hypothetical protein